MSKPVIKVENLAKQYRLGNIGTGSLRDDAQRWWHRVRGKDDPFLTIGETNDRSTISKSDYVWALKDINFEVMPGEVLGIIGKNGAGKSTLLKILSKVTGPTTGRVDFNGRIASLLEVGTGFHPDLTGRENIYLNGAILGMTKREIRSKLDEIIDFSGCERYIDTPVKRYSSGMIVRLGFAVAAHLDPEILIVDEVLAVGDAEFQKKAIGKIQDVSRNQGRTVLFVSHNMVAVENLCTKIYFLQQGTCFFHGAVKEALELYLDSTQIDINPSGFSQLNDEIISLTDFQIKQGNNYDNFITTSDITVSISYELKKEIMGLRVGFDLLDATSGIKIFQSFHDENSETIEICRQGLYRVDAKIPKLLLKEGTYLISLSIGIHRIRWISFDTIKRKFTVLNIGGINKVYAFNGTGVIMPFIRWDTHIIENSNI